MNRNTLKKTVARNFIPVILADNTKATVHVNDLGPMTKYSGEDGNGNKVNSLMARKVEKSIVLQNHDGQIFSCEESELKVLAAGLFGHDLSGVKVEKTLIARQ